MKVKKIFLCSLLMTFVLLISPFSVIQNYTALHAEAASLTKTQKKAKASYSRFLQEGDYTYFRFFDINGDNLKELLVSFDTSEYGVFDMLVYTYKNGKVVYAGRNHSMFGITYNSKTKKLQGSRGGGGSIENWYYTLTKSGKLKPVYLQAIENGQKNGNIIYKYYYNGKRITKSKYVSISKSWSKYNKKFTFYKLNMKNFKAQLKKF